MIIETVDLTPEDASKLLAVSAGHRQRALRRNNVERLTRAIESGDWRETHQAIALNRDGVVIDGQHRLTAIVAANRTVRVTIARDVDDATFDVIDTGSVRSPYDVLKLDGFTNAAKLAAALRVMLTFDEVVGSADSFQTHRQQFTSADILRAAHSERGHELFQCVNAASAVVWALGRPGFTSWMAVALQLMRESPVDDGLALEFVERLRDGANLKEGSPILTLRRFITAGSGFIKVSGGERPQVGLATTIKAFNSYLEGENRRVYIYRVGMERMPAITPAQVPNSPAYIPE